jgi:hypothetical protein
MSTPISTDRPRRQRQRGSYSTLTSSNASDGQDDDDDGDASHRHRVFSSGDDTAGQPAPPPAVVASPAFLRPRPSSSGSVRSNNTHSHHHGSLRYHSTSPGGQPAAATVSPPAGAIALSGSIGGSGASKTVTFFDQVPPAPPFVSSGPLDASTTIPDEVFASSPPSSEQQRVRDLESEVRELSRQLRLLRSRELMSAASSATSGHNIRPFSASHVDGATSLSSSGGPHFDPALSQHAASPTQTGGTHMARSPSEPSSSVAGFPAEAHHDVQSTTPYIMTSLHKPLVASTAGGTIVGLPVSYLDPNLAPYVVGLQNTLGLQHARAASSAPSTSSLPGTANNNNSSSSSGDYHLVPCSVVERRLILFVAPASSRGSAAVFILCTHEGCLRRYTRSVWIEYRSPHETTTTSTLSYHAVNQLTQDLPLPSSATLVDPSENATENMEGLEDDDGGDGGSGGGDRASAAAGDEDLLEGDDGGGSENASSVATWTTSNTNTTTTNLAVQAAAAMHRAALARRGGGGDDSSSPPRERQGSEGSLALALGSGRAVGERVALTGNEGMDRAHSMQQHLPLTREMLELFQPYAFSGGHRGDMSHIDGGSAGVRTSVPPSECSESVVADGDRSSVAGRHTGSLTGHPPGAVPRRSSGQLTAVSVTSAGSTTGGGDFPMEKRSFRVPANASPSSQAGKGAPASVQRRHTTVVVSDAALASISPRSARSPLSNSSLPPIPAPFVVGSAIAAMGSDDASATSIVSASSSSTSRDAS